MARDLRDLERDLVELDPKDKASLARTLIDSLDDEVDEDADAGTQHTDGVTPRVGRLKRCSHELASVFERERPVSL